MLLIVGLGNPGRRYKKTRHNIGFRIVDEFQKENNLPKFRFDKKFQAEVSEDIINGRKVILAKPQTFMNNSGKAVKALLGFYKLSPADLIVAHDELAVPLGEIKISQDKGPGGHKGVESIMRELSTQAFTRLRAGIKPNFEISEYKNFVLKKLSKEEERSIKQAIKKACQALKTSMTNL